MELYTWSHVIYCNKRIAYISLADPIPKAIIPDQHHCHFGYHLIVAEDQSTLESISVEKCSLRSGEGIRRSEFYPIGNIHYSPFLPVREYLTHKERITAPCNVDCRTCQRESIFL